MSIFSGVQSYCVALWDKHKFKEPMLQGAHAIWSLGAAIGPQIIKPFLVELNAKTASTENITTTDSYVNTTYIHTRSAAELSGIAMAQYAYLTVGLIMALSSIPFGILFFYRCGPLLVRSVPSVNSDTATERKKKKKKFQGCGPFCLKFGLLILLFFFNFIYTYNENIPSQFFCMCNT